jgi:CAAX protease family protein
MKAAIRQHPVVTYFLLTFAISWGGVLLSLGGFAGMSAATPTGDPRFVYALLAMVGGPAVSGLFLTALVHGRQGVLAFGSRLVAWRVSARWYMVALLAAPLRRWAWRLYCHA